jgi:hypothetical protein
LAPRLVRQTRGFVQAHEAIAMSSKTKSADEQTALAAMKAQRARDADLAMREYQQEKLAVLARTERLRALRMSRDSQTAKNGEQKQPSSAAGKRIAKKRS